MSSNLNIDPKAFIHNHYFFEWVVNPTKESDHYWNQFISEYPARKKEMEEAIFIIKSIIPEEKELTEEAVLNLWNRIEMNTFGRKKSFFHFTRWMAAASFLLLVSAGYLTYFLLQRTDGSPIDYQSIAQINSPTDEVKLIFSDKSEEVLLSENLDIKYDNAGRIMVNSHPHLNKKMEKAEKEVEQLNQLVVPRGKRTSLTLSDGTKLWLNSGSRAIFPVLFAKEKREIFIEGEAYFDVAHDASKPFYVVTNNFQIKVLGTKFNVSTYPDDRSTSVVLVEGSIQAKIDSKNLTIKPNQLITYEKKTGKVELNEADVLHYISWKDGWLYCEKETLETIATKLSRYYNVKIDFKDAETKKITLTGKLDLKTECSEIFTAISSTAPISFEAQDNSIIIDSK